MTVIGLGALIMVGIAALAVGSPLGMSTPLRCQSATTRVSPKVL